MGELKAEISKLHKKLFEQEKKLHNTLKLLQLSKNQERSSLTSVSGGGVAAMSGPYLWAD